MRTQSLAAIVFASALAGAGVGWMVARHAHSQADEDRTRGVSRPGVAASSARDAVVTAGADGARLAPEDELERATQRARSDPAYLRTLMQQYAAQADLDRKSALLAILGSTGGDEVLRFALQQAASTDPAARSDGLRLLASFSMDRTEVRDALVGQLRDERDPRMTVQLVEMLAPTQVASEDAAPVVQALARLHRHDDADVRAASVLQSAQWDREGDVEDVLQRALLDPAPQVRAAAIAGVTSSRARSPRLKDALLEIASNPDSSSQDRQAAVVALQDFALGRAEYTIYREAAATLAHDE